MDTHANTTTSYALIIPLLFLLCSATAQLSLPQTEQTAVYAVLETINPSVNWRSLYPDDLCVSGPHGIVCDYFTTTSTNSSSTTTTSIHIVELNFGYISDFTSNPACNFTPSTTTADTTPFFNLFSSFPYLKKLFFFNCFTSPTSSPSLPSNLFALLPSSLQELVLIDNPSLSGQLGTSALDLPLRRLIITGTRVSGEIPLLPFTLHQLVLSRNGFNGRIPPSIANCTNLKILDLSYNRLTGPIPGQLIQLVNLVKLDLSYNGLTGCIPGKISGMGKLELLDLSYNQLTGGVPESMGRMVGLKEVYLSGNQGMGGIIPDIWEGIGTNLVGIGFSGMGLVGNIPESMGVFLVNLCYLGLGDNLLEGTLPVQFRQLEGTVREVNLERNRLHGPVPFSVRFMVRMGDKLKLGGNRGLCIVGTGGSKRRNDSLGSLRLPVCNATEMPLPVGFYQSGAGEQGFSGKMILWGFLLIWGILTCL